RLWRVRNYRALRASIGASSDRREGGGTHTAWSSRFSLSASRSSACPAVVDRPTRFHGHESDPLVERARTNARPSPATALTDVGPLPGPGAGDDCVLRVYRSSGLRGSPLTPGRS